MQDILLKLGDFDNAIEYLNDFHSDDIILSALALGCIGDAYLELADHDNALNYYNEAIKNSIMTLQLQDIYETSYDS